MYMVLYVKEEIKLIEKIIYIVLCHLFVHSALYTVPFIIIFGLTWHLIILFISHLIRDTLKARYKIINYIQDQVLHYIVACIYLFI